jgi:cytochrome c553
MKKLLLFSMALAMVFMFSGKSMALETQTGHFLPQCASGEDYEGSCVGNSNVGGIDEDPSGMLAGGIIWSRHNLSSYGEHYQAIVSDYAEIAPGRTDSRVRIIPGTSQSISFGTTQVCVFCHTPHHTSTETGPLWNRNIDNGGFTAYGATIASPEFSTANVSGSSLACLSCHDGVTQMDALINAPGGRSNTDGTNGDMKWAFLENDNVGDGAMRAAVNAKKRTVIGTDLSNDHPIAVAYSTDGRASLRATTDTIASILLYNASSLRHNEQSVIYGRSDNYWSVYGYINTDATIGNLLRDNGQIACASCHDPHFKNLTNNDPSVEFGTPQGPEPTKAITDGDGLFLRRIGGNSNSGVCRTCHNK